MSTVYHQGEANTGMFSRICVNQTIRETLLKLNQKLANQENISRVKVNDTAEKSASSFMKLTKKMKLLYLVNTLNKLKNQIVKYNVKKLFQIWHLYHREDKIVSAIVGILFKIPQYNIQILRNALLNKNKKQVKNKKQRDEICREICQNANLLRIFDRKNIKYCLDNFNTTTAKLKKRIPIIMGFNENDIDAMVKICLYDKTFPLHLLPNIIAMDMKQILNNRLPSINDGTKKRHL